MEEKARVIASKTGE
jgi:hypothetical protein